MDAETEVRLRALLDKEEIRAALLRYCRGVDRRDAELIASAFHSDAVDELHETRGPYIEDPRYRFSSRLRPSSRDLADQTGGMHFVGNVLIDVEGDVAFSESYTLGYVMLRKDGRDLLRLRAGRYLDCFERRDGAWKIAHRLFVDDWSVLGEVEEEGVATLGRLTGRSDLPPYHVKYSGRSAPDDAVYWFRARRPSVDADR